MEKNVGNPEDVRKSTVEPSLLLPFADAPSIGMLEKL